MDNKYIISIDTANGKKASGDGTGVLTTEPLGQVITGSFGKRPSPVETIRVVAPTLETLKTRQCTPFELQLALVKLIEHHNELAIAFSKFEDQQKTSTQAERMNTSYGL